MADLSAFHIAERLAPVPDSRGDYLVGDPAPLTSAWDRHYAALALAAHAAFREELATIPEDPEPGSRPELSYLMAIATSATAAVIALGRPARVYDELWDLTPECGALNGEYIDFLADVLDRHGINPADIYRWFNAADFESVSRC